MYFQNRWIRLNNYVYVGDNTAVSESPTDGDIVAAMTDHAVMGNSDNETEVGTC